MAKPDPIILSKIERSIGKELLIVIILLLLSVVIPVCAWFGIFQQDRGASLWFQRSGSIMVLFAVWAEYDLFKIHELTKPMSDGGETYQDEVHKGVLVTKYRNVLKVINIVSTTLVILGTVIWGYGDLIRSAL